MRLQGVARSEARQLGAERLGAPEMMPQPAAPALRHRERVEQRGEQAEVAEAELEAAEARFAQRLDDQGEHGRIVLLVVRRRERLDAGLTELARVRAGGAAWLIAEGRAAVAVARRHAAAGVARQVQPAGGHGEVGAQAQLLAVGIGEDVGARAQGLADHVEEDARRLDNCRRDLLVAATHKGAHQALGLGCEGFHLLRGFRGHGLAAALDAWNWRAPRLRLPLCRRPAFGIRGRAMRPWLRPAIADGPTYFNCRAKALDASGGGDGSHTRGRRPHLTRQTT